MALGPQKIAILGLSITSSWGNGHATTYRSLVRELSGRGHEVLFLEKDVPWYRENRDLAKPPWCRTGLYSNMEELKDCYEAELREADFVIIGSYVPQGVQVLQAIGNRCSVRYPSKGEGQVPGHGRAGYNVRHP